jgi:hypothetical protein
MLGRWSPNGHKIGVSAGHAPDMRKPSIAGPVALGAAAGVLAAALGDVTMLAAAGVVGLTVLGTARD